MITRIAMLFAVIDRQDQIGLHHLHAAKAFCLHSIDSARPLFAKGGHSPRRRTFSDRVLAKVREGHSTLTELSRALGGKGFTGEELRQSLTALTTEHLLVQGTATTDKGNTVAAWFPVDDPSDRVAIQPADTDGEMATEPMPSIPGELRQLLAKGAEVMVTQDTEAIRLDGASVHVAGGQTGFLAHFTEAATEDDRDFFDRLRTDRPRHHHVIVGDTPLLIDWKVMRLASRVAVA